MNNKNLKILDYGCGYGQFLIALRKLGFNNIMGCDINEEALSFVQSQQIAAIHAHNIFEKPHNCFNIILMNHVLEHFPKEQIIDILTKIRCNLLVANGQLVISVPNAQSYTGCYWAYEDFTHHTLFTAGSLRYVLAEAGFKQIEFVDTRGLDGKNWIQVAIIKFGIKLYEFKNKFWMKITDSHYHSPSPKIYSYEIKAVASS